MFRIEFQIAYKHAGRHRIVPQFHVKHSGRINRLFILRVLFDKFSELSQRFLEFVPLSQQSGPGNSQFAAVGVVPQKCFRIVGQLFSIVGLLEVRQAHHRNLLPAGPHHKCLVKRTVRDLWTFGPISQPGLCQIHLWIAMVTLYKTLHDRHPYDRIGLLPQNLARSSEMRTH